jgi:hypothetical protein
MQSQEKMLNVNTQLHLDYSNINTSQMKKSVISRRNMVIEESRVFDNDEIFNNPSVTKHESFSRS